MSVKKHIKASFLPVGGAMTFSQECQQHSFLYTVYIDEYLFQITVFTLPEMKQLPRKTQTKKGGFSNG